MGNQGSVCYLLDFQQRFVSESEEIEGFLDVRASDVIVL